MNITLAILLSTNAAELGPTSMHPLGFSDIGTEQGMPMPDCVPDQLWFDGSCRDVDWLSSHFGMNPDERGYFVGSRWSDSDFLHYKTPVQVSASGVASTTTYTIVPGANAGAAGPYPIHFGYPVVQKATETATYNSSSGVLRVDYAVWRLVYTPSMTASWAVAESGYTSHDGISITECWDGNCVSIYPDATNGLSCGQQAQDVADQEQIHCNNFFTTGVAAFGGITGGALGWAVTGLAVETGQPAAVGGALVATAALVGTGGAAGKAFGNSVCQSSAIDTKINLTCAYCGSEGVSEEYCSNATEGCKRCKQEEPANTEGSSGNYWLSDDDTTTQSPGSGETTCGSWDWDLDGEDADGDGYCDD